MIGSERTIERNSTAARVKLERTARVRRKLDRACSGIRYRRDGQGQGAGSQSVAPCSRRPAEHQRTRGLKGPRVITAQLRVSAGPDKEIERRARLRKPNTDAAGACVDVCVELESTLRIACIAPDQRDGAPIRSHRGTGIDRDNSNPIRAARLVRRVRLQNDGSTVGRQR